MAQESRAVWQALSHPVQSGRATAGFLQDSYVAARSAVSEFTAGGARATAQRSLQFAKEQILPRFNPRNYQRNGWDLDFVGGKINYDYLDEPTALLRRERNIGAFEELQVPMELKTVKRIASEAGIGLDGVKLRIVRDQELIGRGVFGYTHPKGNIIELYPEAFRNKETLVKTLGHERTHVYHIKTFGPPKNTAEAYPFEEAAYGSEQMWWDFYRKVGVFREKK